MANLLYQTIEQISREKHIEPEVIVAAIEDAMIVAARKYYKTEEDLRAKFNPDSGQVDVFAVRPVVEEVTDPKKEFTLAEAKRFDPNVEVGGEIVIPKPTDVLGRIAAQTAKQVIMQKVREAERDTIYNEYNGRVGELVNCVVKRTEGPDVIVDLGRAEARMPKREQSRLETYNIGDRLRVVIRAVDRSAKGPQVIVSRADPILVQRLFEMEVPEIYDGTVQIRAAAREAGERTKIAVQSRDKDVDPVGACVGMKGMRVQSIIRELRGEKIDIIPYSEDTVHVRAKGAVSREGHARSDHRSRNAAPGSDRRGHAALPGHRQEGPERAPGQQADRLERGHQERGRKAPGDRSANGRADRSRARRSPSCRALVRKRSRRSRLHGISSIEKLADMTPEQLTEIPGIGEKMVEKIQMSVSAYFQSLENPQPETESTEALAEEESAGDTAEQAAAAEETAEAADVAAEDAEAPTEAEEIAEAAAAHGHAGGAEPDASPENSDEQEKK